MREIIYVQAGTTANYVGTHFWNEQDYYATLETNGDEEERIDHEKSFSIKEDPDTRSSSLRPRLLLFERKGNLGGLIRAQALATDQDAGSEPPALWDAPVEEHKEEAIPPSQYLTQLENSEVEEIEPPITVQYWSDFNHSYFSSHSLHVLADLPDSGKAGSILGWTQSKEEFSRVFAEKEIEENDLRYLAEECDYLQGFQMSFDVNHYGGFISSFHGLLQDEYPKLDTLNFAFLATNAYSETYTPKTAPLLLNDIMTIHGLSLLEGYSVPLFQRQYWPRGSWSQHLDLDDTIFHTSALYAAHIESITYPLRQLGGQDTIRSIFSSSAANLYELSGILPIWSKDDIDVSSILDVTTLGHLPFERRTHSRLFARGVARGCPNNLLGPLKEKLYLSESTLLGYSRPYLLPLSHPQFFRPDPPLPSATPGRIVSVPTVTLLSQTCSLASILDKYVRHCQEIMKRGCDLADGRYGVDRDELAQVVEDLFNARDAYGYFDQDQGEEYDLDI